MGKVRKDAVMDISTLKEMKISELNKVAKNLGVNGISE